MKIYPSLLVGLLLVQYFAAASNSSDGNTTELTTYSRGFQCCVYTSSLGVDSIDTLEHFLDVFSKCKQHLELNTSSVDDFVKTITYAMQTLNEDPTCLLQKPMEPVCSQDVTNGYIAYAIFLIFILIVAALGNILVMIVYMQSRSLRRHVTYLFVNSLAVSDLLVAMTVIPVKVVLAIHNHHFCSTNFVCKFYFTTDVLFFTASITNILSVTIDRFIAIMVPFKYKDILTLSRVRIWVACVWVYSFCWAVLVHLNHNTGTMDNIGYARGYCYHKSDYYFVVLYVAVFIIPCSAMGMVYVKVYAVTSLHSKHIKSQHRLGRISSITSTVTSSNTHDDSNLNFNVIRNVADVIVNAARKVEWKVTKVLLFVYGSFFLCWIPLILIFFLDKYKNNNLSYYVKIFFTEVLPILHSTCNPFIYSIMHRDFRKELGRVLMLRTCPNCVVRHFTQREGKHFYSQAEQRTRAETIKMNTNPCSDVVSQSQV